MKKLIANEKSRNLDVLEVTKAEVRLLQDKHDFINDLAQYEEYVKDFSDETVVGYIFGDIDKVNVPNADIWFMLKEFFDKNYTLRG